MRLTGATHWCNYCLTASRFSWIGTFTYLRRYSLLLFFIATRSSGFLLVLTWMVPRDGRAKRDHMAPGNTLGIDCIYVGVGFPCHPQSLPRLFPGALGLEFWKSVAGILLMCQSTFRSTQFTSTELRQSPSCFCALEHQYLE